MDLGSLGRVVLVFAVGIIIASVAVDIVSNIKAGQTAGSAAYNVLAKGEEGLLKLLKFPSIKILLIILIIVILFKSIRSNNRV